MATPQQQNRGGTATAPQPQQRRPDPEPIDTRIASPLGRGNIIDLGNRFQIPGYTSEKGDSELYKFTNGKTFNLAEVLAVINAEKLGLEEGPKFMFRKGTKLEGSDRYSYKGGLTYDAEARLTAKGLKVHIPERAEGEDNGQGQGQRSGGAATDTGVKTHLGTIKLSSDGKKYFVGSLSIATNMRGTDISAEQIGAGLDATKEGLDNNLPLEELLPKLPVVDFVSGRGAAYQKALTVNTKTGFIEFHDLPGQERRQGGYQRGGNDRGDRGGSQQQPAAGGEDYNAGDFEQGPSGEETDGENFSEEQHHEAPAQAPALRSNRGYRR